MSEPTLIAELRATYTWLQARGLVPDERRVDSLPTPTLHVDGRLVVSFCSNNYLGLNHRPDIKAAAAAALDAHSYATSESRRLGGNLVLLERLEAAIAEFKRSGAALVTATGLLANIVAVHGLVDTPHLAARWHGAPRGSRDPVVIYDERAHRSIRMGATLSRAGQLRFRHNDPGHLAELLDVHARRGALVVTEGVFSMDGDLADLPGILEVCERAGALLMVDDAHGTGVYGADGSGTVEHHVLTGRVPVQVATLSKALGGMGGAVLADPPVVALLRTFASGYRFTSSLPAEQAAGLLAALSSLRAEPELRQRLWRNVGHLREGLASLGIDVPGDGPIMPIGVGMPETATRLEHELLDRGLWCAAIKPPAVPVDECRLRLTVTAMHKPAHVERLVDVLDEIGASRMVAAAGQAA